MPPVFTSSLQGTQGRSGFFWWALVGLGDSSEEAFLPAAADALLLLDVGLGWGRGGRRGHRRRWREASVVGAFLDQLLSTRH